MAKRLAQQTESSSDSDKATSIADKALEALRPLLTELP